MYANPFGLTVPPGHTFRFQLAVSTGHSFRIRFTVFTEHKISSSLAFGAWFIKLK